jgi:hypothetical protein
MKLTKAETIGMVIGIPIFVPLVVILATEYYRGVKYLYQWLFPNLLWPQGDPVHGFLAGVTVAVTIFLFGAFLEETVFSNQEE